jgi:hypothetical protein
MKLIIAATSTPLSSIFGSGFLIIVLLLFGVAVSALAVPLIVAAALSQFSAAVEDILAATGNISNERTVLRCR